MEYEKLKTLPGKVIGRVLELQKIGSIYVPQGVGVGAMEIVAVSEDEEFYQLGDIVYFNKLDAVPLIDDLKISDFANQLVLLWGSSILCKIKDSTIEPGPGFIIGKHLSFDNEHKSMLLSPDTHIPMTELIQVQEYVFLIDPTSGFYVRAFGEEYRITREEDLLAEVEGFHGVN